MGCFAPASANNYFKEEKTVRVAEGRNDVEVIKFDDVVDTRRTYLLKDAVYNVELLADEALAVKRPSAGEFIVRTRLCMDWY